MLQVITKHVKPLQYITTRMVSNIQGRRHCSHGPNTCSVATFQPIKDGIGLVITLVSPYLGLFLITLQFTVEKQFCGCCPALKQTQ